MFLTVDLEDKRPLYQQVVDGVKGLIAAGQLREGMTLPSVRQVAGDLGVNLNTIAIAYRQLQDEGFLTVRHGSGAVVASRQGRSVGDSEFRRSLRTVLTEFLLGGFTDEDIVNVVHQELAALRQKGAAR
jgi:GntR family transcriptional regulator